MMMRPITLTLAMLALCACQPQDPDGKPAEAPADAPAAPAAATPAASTGGMDIGQPIRALGTEPFWALDITGGTKFKLSRPDQPDLLAEAPGSAMSPGGATWVARGAKGEQLTVTVKLGECSDGMSDLKYPMTAEVVLLNETLKGCAAKTAELHKEGG
jgi:uncharacterized membrane protein